jgi:preprotein translocase subunit SecG
LTRATAILAGCFMATSITLAILASSGGQSGSIVDESAPAAEAPAGEDAPGTPSAPER